MSFVSIKDAADQTDAAITTIGQAVAYMLANGASQADVRNGIDSALIDAGVTWPYNDPMQSWQMKRNAVGAGIKARIG